MMINQGYDDYEEAYALATRKVSAQELTKHLMEFQCLWCHLQDVVQIIDRRGREFFEVMCVAHDDNQEGDA